MTLITITLSEEEQRKLLDLYRRFPVTLQSIAEKVRKTRRAEEAFRTAYEQPDTAECGLCDIPKDIHPDLTADHHWQWLRKPVPAEPPVREDKREGGPDETVAYWGDLPREPAG